MWFGGRVRDGADRCGHGRYRGIVISRLKEGCVLNACVIVSGAELGKKGPLFLSDRFVVSI